MAATATWRRKPVTGVRRGSAVAAMGSSYIGVVDRGGGYSSSVLMASHSSSSCSRSRAISAARRLCSMTASPPRS